ncbi:MAG: hypothetical protein E6K18_03740 [Methanobacteriota archaeon]|nr:MAG: hypothetical protein E6K18_03740 [Euryarchaeota archaeon]
MTLGNKEPRDPSEVGIEFPGKRHTPKRAPSNVSTAKVLGIALVVAALVGSVAGFAAGRLFSPAAALPRHAVEAREYWVFTVVLPFNDNAPGLPPHDYFAPDRITVFQGDNITIHFFNTESEPENHTFTMDAPYAMDHVLPYNATTTFTFTASVSGIFQYRCLYHQPTMSGWLIVLDN